MAKRLTNIKSSRVKSSRIDWSQENEKQLHRTGPAIARLLWQTTFLFYFPSSAALLFSLSFAKFISHFHFVCHCRLAGFSSSITQRETAKERLKNPFAKTSHSGHLYL